MPASLEDSTMATGLAKVSHHSNHKEGQCQRMFRLLYLLRNMYVGQEETIRNGHVTVDWFRIGKGVRQGCIHCPGYLISVQSPSCEMPGCMKLKLESRLLGDISITSDT